MKLALRHLFLCALLLVAGFGAQAQGDEVIERYGLSLVNLSESVRLLESDVAASRSELDSAAGALRFLATEAGDPGLVAALERVFDRARTAITNRSATDLAVQSALIRGGYQRAVFDSAIALLESEPVAARARLERLAIDLGLSEEARASLAAAANVDAIRRVFEAAVADGIAEKLASVQASYGQSQDDAYRSLASAYADYLIVQDSPRAQVQFNSQFGVAATSLVESRTEDMSAALASLGGGFQGLAQAARAQPSTGESSAGGETSATPGEVVVGDESAVGEVVAGQPSETQVTEMPPVSLGQVQANQAVPAEPAPETAAPTTPSTTTPDATSTTVPAEPGTQPAEADEAAAAVETTTVDDEAAEEAARLQALRVELIANGVPPAQAEGVATRLDARGVSSLESALDGLYAQAGRVVAAVGSGETGSAREALEGFNTDYQQQLQPALELISPAVDERVTDLVASLVAVPALRAQDALVLLGQVEAVDNLLAGEPSSNVQIINTQATTVWAGWVRIATLIALALLAIVPLYLLNLAFGGGNRNWQLIGVALFLLLLPVIYEGLASIGAVAAHYSGVDVLGILLGFSMFHNPIAQIVWAAITAVAVLFAVAGLYGICVQFGLLGSRRATVSDSQTLRSTAVVPDADTVVDWDEEF